MTPETWAEQLRTAADTLGIFKDHVGMLLPSGRDYEKRFQDAVELLVAEGTVKGLVKTTPNSADDAKGIDYFLQLAEGIEVPFQVTSTFRHLQMKKEKHPNIPVIYGRAGKRLFCKEYLARRILKLAGEFLLESAFREIQLRGQQLKWRKSDPASPEETIYKIVYGGRSTQVHLVSSGAVSRSILDKNPQAVIVKPRNKKGWKSFPQIKTEVESALGLKRENL